MIEPIWTIQEAIGITRILEPIAVAQGYHVALGGSTLIHGVSMKDLDIFLYLHTEKGWKTKATSVEQFVTSLSEIGFKSFQDRENKDESASDGMYKRVVKTEYLSRQIEPIFLLDNQQTK